MTNFIKLKILYFEYIINKCLYKLIMSLNKEYIKELPSDNKSYGKYDNGNYDNNNEFKFNRFNKRQEVNVTAVLEDNKIPISCSINTDVIDITGYDIKPVFSERVDMPRFSLGFHHWIHASKSKTEENFKKFDKKKKVYQVVNGYERYVDNYDKSIGIISQKYEKNILSRAFYKLWEILCYYDLIDTSQTNFVSAHLAEGPGSFVQATIVFRQLYSKNIKNDSYHAITIHGDKNDEQEEDVPNKFFEHPNLKIHKTYNKSISRSSETKDNGDLTSTKTIKNFKKELNVKVDLVTGDGGFEWNNENIQEQECALLIYSQIITALQIQKKGGSFVLKMFEMFTKISCKFIIILKYFYETVYIVKPLTSRDSNSERYIICKNFKFDEKHKIHTYIDQMLDILDLKNNFMTDIYPDIDLPQKLILEILTINLDLSNLQFSVINKMIEYIEGSDYYGDKYNDFRDRQIRLTDYWVSIFMSEQNKNIENAKKIIAISEKMYSNKLEKTSKFITSNNLINLKKYILTKSEDKVLDTKVSDKKVLPKKPRKTKL